MQIRKCREELTQLWKSADLRFAGQDRDEKSIGPGPARRHQKSFGGEQGRIAKRRGLVTQRFRYVFNGCDRKGRMAFDKCAHLRRVFLRQHRAGDVDNSSTWTDKCGRAVEHFDLVLETFSQRARTNAPLRVRIAPPCAGAGGASARRRPPDRPTRKDPQADQSLPLGVRTST